jgi:nitroreductase
MTDQITTAPAEAADLFEIIRTTRSMCRLKLDPVPNESIRQVLEAGTCAPSGGNTQRWKFLVIRDPQVKQTVGILYRRAWDDIVAPRYRSGEPAPGTDRQRFDRMFAAVEHLAHHIHEAPVWIVPCLQGESPIQTVGSSIYPAVQNMLLAARALGLGATLTTLYLNFEKEAEAALGLPGDWHSYAMIPVGYPLGRQCVEYNRRASDRHHQGYARPRWSAAGRGRCSVCQTCQQSRCVQRSAGF